MSYNVPPPPAGDIGLDGGPGLGGFGFPGGFGGFPGFGKSFNLDVGGGFGGFPGLFGGGFPGGFGGWGGPYLPVTPLGSLWGFKGDLIVPMVAIGVAIFIFLLIVLAVKYALAWKLQFLDDLAGVKKFRRDAGLAPAEQLETDNLNRLTDIVAASIYSEGCSRRILCEMGSYARQSKQYSSLIRLVELVVPEPYHGSFSIMRNSAENEFNCAENYPCGGNPVKPPNPAENEIDVNGGTKQGGNATSSANTTTPTTPAPTILGKFKRAVFK